MKIIKVEVMLFKTALPSCRPIGCRIYTDEGIYGDGEAALDYGIGAPAAFGMIEDLSKLIIGMNPLDNEVIWDMLFKNTFWGQNGGPVVFAGISAIDMALWDIKGKYFKVPIYQLLGGKKRDNLRCYASQLQVGWSEHFEKLKGVKEYAEVAKKAVSEGYDAIKIDFLTFDKDGRRFEKGTETIGLLSPYYVNLVEERVAAVREAVGPNVDIIIENHSNTDANSSVQLGRAVQKYKIFYFEEPNTPTPATTKWIGDQLDMPIAHGERIYSRWQWVPYLENKSVQLMQPDIGTCGGFTETKKVCDMAYAYDVGVQAHVCASPLSTAAALQLECVLPNFVIHEHHRFCLLQMMKDLCIYDYQPENGKYKVPELPGIGNEFSEKAIKECSKMITVE